MPDNKKKQPHIQNTDELKYYKEHFCSNYYSNIKQQLGARILFLRKEYGYTQEQVANTLGITRISLSYYERGERSIDIETLYKIAELFNTSVDFLMGLSPYNTPKGNYDEIYELHTIGFSSEILDKLWGNPNFLELFCDIVTHKDFYLLEKLTYHSRYTEFEEIDAGYRSFLTAKLLYSMISDIFLSWYFDNPYRIKELTDNEKKQIISEIEQYLEEKQYLEQTRTLDFEYTDQMHKKLCYLYNKLKKYM